MKIETRRGLAILLALGCIVPFPLLGQQGEPVPVSEWGPEDQRGAAHRITPEKVMEAAALIREGRIYSLGRTYEDGMPLFGARHFRLTLVGAPTGGPLGTNRVVWNEEMVTGELGQVGTQFDGLGHVGVRIGGQDVYYNRFVGSEVTGSYGLQRLGVENVGPIVTRGVLIDVAGHRGVERLAPGTVITKKDLEEALAAEQIRIRSGDAVLVRTGHGALWMADNQAYMNAEPGIGLEAARWLLQRRVVLVGADNFGIEVVPSEDATQAFPVHELFLVRHGVYNLENLYLDDLARDRVYEFAFVFVPLPLRGATGSPGNPVALR